ncbi:MAG: N-formylglutamate amidohydrolase [Planctomycetota bacterium]|jgi:N-formylglutamate deformylase
MSSETPIRTYDLRIPEAQELPLLLSIPHSGVEVPERIRRRFTGEKIEMLPDTDFHLQRLYDFAPEMGVRTIQACFNRFVVDLNRPAEQRPMYEGRDETSVVPTSSFASEAIYLPGQEPGEDEIQERIALYWQPYHDRLAEELAGLRDRHGFALLFDAHSIRSQVPRFFEGDLPGLMLGDVDGSSADERLSAAVLAVHEKSCYSWQANDPFRGGYITRSCGNPGKRIHALQLEMSQRLYMDEFDPFLYMPDLADELRPVLRASLEAYIAAARQL